MFISDAQEKEEWKNYFIMGSNLGLQYFEHAKANPYWHPDSVFITIKGRKKP